MAFIEDGSPETREQSPPEEYVVSGSEWNPLKAAALVGGALAATAGAYLGTRALAKRNGAREGKPVNSVMATAITACDMAHRDSPAEPPVAIEPEVPTEPRLEATGPIRA